MYEKIMQPFDGEHNRIRAHVLDKTTDMFGTAYVGALTYTNGGRHVWTMEYDCSKKTRSAAFDDALYMLDNFEHVNIHKEKYFRRKFDGRVETESGWKNLLVTKGLAGFNVGRGFEEVRRLGGQWVHVEEEVEQ